MGKEAACHVPVGPCEGARGYRARPVSRLIIPTKHTSVPEGGCHSHFDTEKLSSLHKITELVYGRVNLEL